MKTKLTRIGDDVVLEFDSSLLEQIGLDENSEVEISVNGDQIVLTPIRETDRERRLRESMEKIDEKYADVFRRLAE